MGRAVQGWTGHPSLSCAFDLRLHRTPAPDVVALCLVTRYASQNAAFGPMDCSCRKGSYMVHQHIEQDPGHSAVPDEDDRPLVEAAISCSTRTVRRRDGWRPIQTTSGPLLFDGRWPNSTLASSSSEDAPHSITAAHKSSNIEAEQNLFRPSQRRHRRTPNGPWAITWSHLANYRQRRSEQDKERDKFCASLVELDRKNGASGGIHE